MYCQNTKIFHLFSFFINRKLISKGHIQLPFYFLVRKTFVAILLGFVILSLVPDSFSQISSACENTKELVCVTTSEKAYEEEDTIVISGKVTAIIEDSPVTLQIFQEGTLVEIAQLIVAQDGRFTHTINAQGPLWQTDGIYVVRASYGTSMVESSFEFFTKKTASETTDIFEVDAGSAGTFDVDYTIKGAIVKDMVVDPDIFALIVIIESESDGSVTLNLPRNSIDAKKSDGADDTYIILIDGVEVPYEETVTNQESRTIKIQFEEGDSDIEIIGTFVIPEFGEIAMIVFLIAILSTVIISFKKGILKNFIPQEI